MKTRSQKNFRSRLKAILIVFLLCSPFTMVSVLGQSPETFNDNAVTTWHSPVGVTSVTVECWGAGGGGGGFDGSKHGSGGGGGGAYSIKVVTVTEDTDYTFSVGIGGAQGNLSAGGTGGDTWFWNATTVMAKGGTGGDPATGGGGSAGGAGGTGGVAGSGYGDTRYSGGDGGDGNTANDGFGGGGGSSAGTAANGAAGGTGVSGGGPGGTAPAGGGDGGDGGDANFAGVIGVAPGGAGGGSGEKGNTGGAGTNGRIVLTYSSPPSITLVITNPAVCQGTTTANITYSALGGGANEYSVDWDPTANSAGFSDVAYTAIPASPIGLTVPGAVAPATYNANLRVRLGASESGDYAITVTVNAPTPAQPGAITGDALVYPTDNTLVYSITAVTDATTYNWSVPTNWSIDAGGTTISVTVTSGFEGDNGNITVSAQNSCGTSSNQTKAVVVADDPTITLTDGDPVVCQGTTTANVTYSGTTSSPDQYSIVYSGAAIAAGFVNVTDAAIASPIVLTVPGAAAAATYTATLTLKNSTTTRTSSGDAISVTVNPPTPAQPGAITGDALVYSSDNSLVYSITAVPNATTYNWGVPAGGWSIDAGGTTISITVTSGNEGDNGNITVNAQNSCGTSADRTFAVVVADDPTITLTDGDPVVCQGTTTANVTYSGTTSSPDLYSIVYSGAAIAAGFVNVTDAAIASPIVLTVPGAAAAATYTATLTLKNSTTTRTSSGDAISVTVNPPTPAQPGAITGDALVYSSDNSLVYSISAVPNATTYNWGVPAGGWSIDAGGTTISITVTSGSEGDNGNITVNAQNSCGTSADQTKAVVVADDPTITITAGDPAVCQGTTTANVTYSATTSSPNQYSINYDATAEGQGFVDVTDAAIASPIVLTVPGGAAPATYNGTLTVKNSTTTRVSGNYAITVTVDPPIPAQPGAITGSAIVNPATGGVVYSISAVPNATTYNWGLPAGAWSLDAGSGTISITVTTGGLGDDGNITVNAQNSCGTSANRILAVTIASSDCPVSNTISGGPQTHCKDDVASALTCNITTSGGTGTPTLKYQWYYNTTNSVTLAGATTVGGATSQDYTPLTSTAEDRWYFCVGYAEDNGCAQNDGMQSLASDAAANVDVNDVASAGAISGPTIVGTGETGIEYSITPVAGATNYTWSVPGNPGQWFITGGQGTATITVTAGSKDGDVVEVFVTNACGDGPVSQLVVSAVDCPTATDVAPLPVQDRCIDVAANQLTATITTTGSPPLAYQWYYNTSNSNTVSGAVKIGGATNVNYTPPTDAGAFGSRWYFCVGYTTDVDCSQNDAMQSLASDPAVNINVIDVPAQPGAITGSATPSASTGGYVYSISSVATATGYTWSVPAGDWTIDAGQGTISITVTAGLFGEDGDITVTADNSCGSGTAQTKAVVVSASGTPPTITLGANPAVCQSITTANLTYSATTESPDLYSIDYDATAEGQGFVDVVDAALPASPIVHTVPGGAAIGTYNGNLTVKTSGTGLSSGNYAITVGVLGAPAVPGAITGATVANPSTSGLIYSISAVPTATSYTWTVPTGWSIDGGQGTVSISVTSGVQDQNGDITVTATSSCGTSAAQVKAVFSSASVTITLGASPIVCQGATTANLPYVATSGNPDEYMVDFSPGAEGQGFADVSYTALPASPIILTVPGGAADGAYSALLKVKNSSTGVPSVNYPFTVTVEVTPVAPSVISGPTTVNELETESYNILPVTYADSYNWGVPVGWTINSGNGTTGISVDVGNAGDDGNITVNAQNTCGTSANFNYAVTVVTPTNHDNYQCDGCHVFHNAPGGALTATDGNDNLCMNCHAPGFSAQALPFAVSDKAVPGTSGNSHAWGKPAVNANYETLLPLDGNLVITDGNIICSTCHDQHLQTYAPYLQGSITNDEICKDCHRERDLQKYTDDPPNNRGSHPVGVVYPADGATYHNPPTGGNLQVINGNIECRSCHDVHYAGTSDGNILKQAFNAAMCLDCHNGITTHNAMDCLDCHEMHNAANYNNNIYLIKDTITTPNSGDREVIFTALTGSNSFADGDVTYDGVCEVCHTLAASSNHHNFEPPDPTNANHYSGQECTASCHSHYGDFTPAGGCVDCHNAPVGSRPRPQIVGAGGEFDQASKHTNIAPVDADCEKCHYMGGTDHQDGTISLIEPDDMVTEWGGGAALDTTLYCLRCHDGTPPGGVSFPVPVADYDKSGFNGTAHHYTTNSCMECHDAHGSPNADMLLTAGDNYTACRACHDGAPGTNINVTDIAIPGTSGNSHKWGMDGTTGAYESNAATLTAITDRLNGVIVECNSCHDPHSSNTKYLVTDNSTNQMCKDCHDARNKARYQDNVANKGTHPVGIVYPGTGSVKATPTGSVITVGGNVECSSCHMVHNATTSDGNLLRQTNNNTLCTDCHVYGAHQGKGCLECHDVHNSSKTNIYMIANTVNFNTVEFTAETGSKSFADGDATLDGICEACHNPALTDHHTTTADGHNHKDGTNCTTAACHTHATNFAKPSCINCHDQVQGSSQIVGAGGEFDVTLASTHKGGSTPTEPADADCATCHVTVDGTESHMMSPTSPILKDPDASTAWSGDLDNYCMACHDGTPAVDKKTTYFNSVHDNYATNSCMSCHERHGSANSTLLTQNTNYLVCRTCHDGIKSTIDINITNKAITMTSGNNHAWDITPGSYETAAPTTSPMDTRLVGGKVMCNTCHDPHDNTNGKFLVNDNTGVGNEDAMCKDCHSARDVGNYAGGGMGSHPVGVTYTGGGAYQASAPTLGQTSVGLVNGKVECSSCHQMHNANTADGTLLRQTNSITLCTSCHTYGAHQGNNCSICHEVHNSNNKTNIYMISESVNSNAVVFTAETGTNSFADGDATLNGICEVCHSGLHHNSTGDGHNHQDGTNCTTAACHTHATNFAKPSCINCHDQVQGSVAQIVGSGGEFDVALTSTHKGGSSPTEPADVDCKACHWPVNAAGDESHMMSPTSPILKDPDASSGWTGDVNDYCMACHDGTPAVDKSAFATTVHDTYATNSCMSCHERHGSSNSTLLTQSTNYAVCRTCHTTALPGFDIDILDKAVTQSSGNSHTWDITPGSYGTTAPATSPMDTRLVGDKVMCNTCHDPHDNSNGKFLVTPNNTDQMCKDCHADRDESNFAGGGVGSHPVGVAYTAGGEYQSPAPTVGQTSVGPISGNMQCRSCHQMHNANQTDGTLLRQAKGDALCKTCHLVGDGQGVPAGTHNNMTCMDCHTAHGSGSNIFLIKETIATPNSGNRAVVFTSETAFVNGSPNYNGICEVCHTTNTNTWHYNTSSGIHTHEVGNNCTGCHTHATNFKKPVCHGCHDATPGSFAYPLDADGYNTGAHDVHCEPPYEYVCSTCHFGKGSGGATEPAHPDPATPTTAEVVFDPSGKATLNGASPTWNGTTCSNVYCHSNGGNANRYQDADGVAIWNSDASPTTMVYATIPAWATGTITQCSSCHEGPATKPAAPNFTITEGSTTGQVTVNSQYPNSGAHGSNTGAHNSPDQIGAPWDTHTWPLVQCFWCHNYDAGAASGVPKYQGTYATDEHINGRTWFYPFWYGYNGMCMQVGGGKLPAGWPFATQAECETAGHAWQPPPAAPYGYSMIEGLEYSWTGPGNQHCGNGKNCW